MWGIKYETGYHYASRKMLAMFKFKSTLTLNVKFLASTASAK